MNVNGHKENLIAAHPGNQNARTSGAYARDVDAEAAEITESFPNYADFNIDEREAAYDFIKTRLTLRRIDDYLEAKGEIRSDGDVAPALKERNRLSRRLQSLGPKVAAAQARAQFKTGEAEDVEAFRRALTFVAGGYDPRATPRDQLLAYRELQANDGAEKSPKTITVIFKEDGDKDITYDYGEDEMSP